MSLEDKIGKIEKALNEIKKRLAKVEEKVGISQPSAEIKPPERLVAPIPTPSTPSAPIPKPKSSTPSAPVPKPASSTPSAPVPKPASSTPSAPVPTTSSTTSSIDLKPTVRKKQIIKQSLPRGGATSQIKAIKGIYHCPQCDSDYYEELEDKKRPLYTMGPGLAIYAKKLRCWNCGNEWPKPS
ncbi:MAG: hypothetical protein HWN67_10710 [Candidatus Helarchaeota archaeon]|nr:hypothetical protein [Candidatus Helarchaeota archaeon]